MPMQTTLPVFRTFVSSPISVNAFGNRSTLSVKTGFSLPPNNATAGGSSFTGGVGCVGAEEKRYVNDAATAFFTTEELETDLVDCGGGGLVGGIAGGSDRGGTRKVSSKDGRMRFGFAGAFG